MGVAIGFKPTGRRLASDAVNGAFTVNCPHCRIVAGRDQRHRVNENADRRPRRKRRPAPINKAVGTMLAGFKLTGVAERLIGLALT